MSEETPIQPKKGKVDKELVYKLACIGKKIAFTIEKAILLFVPLEYERNIEDGLVLVLTLALIAIGVLKA